jgi:hypothetical protein
MSTTKVAGFHISPELDDRLTKMSKDIGRSRKAVFESLINYLFSLSPKERAYLVTEHHPNMGVENEEEVKKDPKKNHAGKG